MPTPPLFSDEKLNLMIAFPFSIPQFSDYPHKLEEPHEVRGT